MSISVLTPSVESEVSEAVCIVCISCLGSAEKGKTILYPLPLLTSDYDNDNLVSRDRFGRPVPRQSAWLHPRLNLVLAHEISSDFREGVQMYLLPQSGQS